MGEFDSRQFDRYYGAVDKMNGAIADAEAMGKAQPQVKPKPGTYFRYVVAPEDGIYRGKDDYYNSHPRIGLYIGMVAFGDSLLTPQNPITPSHRNHVLLRIVQPHSDIDRWSSQLHNLNAVDIGIGRANLRHITVVSYQDAHTEYLGAQARVLELQHVRSR